MSAFVPYRNAKGAIHNLSYAGGLSAERTIPLLVSPRVLYVLQNLASLDVSLECRYAVDIAEGGYLRLTTDDGQYSDFLELVSDVGVQLRERAQMWETADVRLVAWAGQYGGPDPLDWIHCDGRAISRTIYANLFAMIGVAYGAGNGSTTFNIPDLRGKCPQGWNDDDAVGETVGIKMQTQIPQHNHILDAYVGTSSGFYLKNSNLQGTLNHPYTGYAGEPSGVDQRGPRLAMGWVIKT